MTFFYEDSIYYFVEKKDFEKVYQICKFYFKNFDYTAEDIKKILESSNPEESLNSLSNYYNTNNATWMNCNECKKQKLYDSQKSTSNRFFHNFFFNLERKNFKCR